MALSFDPALIPGLVSLSPIVSVNMLDQSGGNIPVTDSNEGFVLKINPIVDDGKCDLNIFWVQRNKHSRWIRSLIARIHLGALNRQPALPVTHISATI